MTNPVNIGGDKIQKVMGVDVNGNPTNTGDGTKVSVITNSEEVSTQNPLPSDGDSVYVKDLDLTISDNFNFTGEVSDYFDSLTSVNSDTTGNAVKLIKLWFNRTVYTSAIGFGCNDLGSSFSQTIVLKFLGSGEVVRKTVTSTIGDLNSRVVPFDPTAFNGVIIEFHTTNPVSLSNITIRKEVQVSAILQGLNPNNVLQYVNTNILGNLLVSLDEQKDAFGRLKTAEPYTIFDSSLTNVYADNLFWGELINGTASSTFNEALSHKLLEVATDGDYIVRQTKQRFKYQPAKSHEFFITGLWNTEAGKRKRGGLVDYDNKGLATITNVPQNGVFFENNGGILSWNIANNGVITETSTQENWNIDKSDGTGRSGFIFNPDATNIITCQLEWLGVGVVLVGFAIGAGSVIYCHAFTHASVEGIVDVYMRTANLPVSYELTSISGAGSMKAICSSVISGGGFNPVGDTDATFNTSNISISNGDTELLVGIRLQEDEFEYTVDPTQLSILSTSNGNTQWVLCLNPIYTGTTTFVDKDNSIIQESTNNNNIVTNFGKIIVAGSFSNNTDSLNESVTSALKIGKDLLGNRDELWLCVTALGNENYRGTINYKQLI